MLTWERAKAIAEQVNERVPGTVVEGGGGAGPWVSTPLVGERVALWGPGDGWYASVYAHDGNPDRDDNGLDGGVADDASVEDVAAAIARAVGAANDGLLKAAGQLELSHD